MNRFKRNIIILSVYALTFSICLVPIFGLSFKTISIGTILGFFGGIINDVRLEVINLQNNKSIG